ncbi:hypothetical protein KR074_007693 [Drosophila pseudoananassae]|nr:hypothetical protein KR074_007693 [Drosophila pseudoananassae]
MSSNLGKVKTFLADQTLHNEEPEGEFEGSVGFLNRVALNFYMIRDYFFPIIEYKVNHWPKVSMIQLAASITLMWVVIISVKYYQALKARRAETKAVPPTEEGQTTVTQSNITKESPMEQNIENTSEEINEKAGAGEAPQLIENQTPGQLEKEKIAQMYDDLLLGKDDDDDKELSAALSGATDTEIPSTLISRLGSVGRSRMDGVLPPVTIGSIRAQKKTQTYPATGLFIEKDRPQKD